MAVEIELVRQEHPEGCLVACLAMVSGRTYAEVDAMFVRDRYEDGGLNDYQVFDFLADEGILWRHVHRYSHIGASKERPVWPLPLDADLTICRVDAGRGGHLSHAIVVTRDGTAFDPALGMRRLSDYAAVGAMTFLSALRPSPSSDERVKVKALVWERLSSKIWDASAVGGLYRIRYENETWTAFKYGDTFRADRGTEQEAKAAAQADYETRIRSALDLPGDERVDLRDSVLEECAKVADAHAKHRSKLYLEAKLARKKFEARDHESMAMEANMIASNIRALQPHKGE